MPFRLPEVEPARSITDRLELSHGILSILKETAIFNELVEHALEDLEEAMELLNGS